MGMFFKESGLLLSDAAVPPVPSESRESPAVRRVSLTLSRYAASRLDEIRNTAKHGLAALGILSGVVGNDNDGDGDDTPPYPPSSAMGPSTSLSLVSNATQPNARRSSAAAIKSPKAIPPNRTPSSPLTKGPDPLLNGDGISAVQRVLSSFTAHQVNSVSSGSDGSGQVMGPLTTLSGSSHGRPVSAVDVLSFTSPSSATPLALPFRQPNVVASKSHTVPVNALPASTSTTSTSHHPYHHPAGPPPPQIGLYPFSSMTKNAQTIIKANASSPSHSPPPYRVSICHSLAFM